MNMDWKKRGESGRFYFFKKKKSGAYAWELEGNYNVGNGTSPIRRTFR